VAAASNRVKLQSIERRKKAEISTWWLFLIRRT
jgi:hypothetical protein